MIRKYIYVGAGVLALAALGDLEARRSGEQQLTAKLERQLEAAHAGLARVKTDYRARQGELESLLLRGQEAKLLTEVGKVTAEIAVIGDTGSAFGEAFATLEQHVRLAEAHAADTIIPSAQKLPEWFRDEPDITVRLREYLPLETAKEEGGE